MCPPWTRVGIEARAGMRLEVRVRVRVRAKVKVWIELLIEFWPRRSDLVLLTLRQRPRNIAVY